MEHMFQDLQVVELSSVLAGPAVGMFFAELGARVTKVENIRTNGDVTRSWRLASEQDENVPSAYFASVNYGKQSVFADLSLPEDRSRVRELIASADVVITNFRREDAEKLQFTASDLRKDHPGLIVASISGFGDSSDRVAYDVVLQAETGFMFMNGTATSGPVKLPVAFIDLFAAHQLKEGILLALLKRTRTDRGSTVSVSLYDAAISSLANQATNWLIAGHDPGRMGSLHPNIAPYGEMFFTADGKMIVLAVGNDRQFHALCEVLQLKDNVDERFATNPSRVRNRAALQDILHGSINQRRSAQLMHDLDAASVPAAIIKPVSEALHNPLAGQMLRVNESGQRIVSSIAFRIRD